jgi:hypothetical protein
MLAERSFRVVLVGKGHGVGASETAAAEATVSYKGTQAVTSF